MTIFDKEIIILSEDDVKEKKKHYTLTLHSGNPMQEWKKREIYWDFMDSSVYMNTYRTLHLYLHYPANLTLPKPNTKTTLRKLITIINPTRIQHMLEDQQSFTLNDIDQMPDYISQQDSEGNLILNNQEWEEEQGFIKEKIKSVPKVLPKDEYDIKKIPENNPEEKKESHFWRNVVIVGSIIGFIVFVIVLFVLFVLGFITMAVIIYSISVTVTYFYLGKFSWKIFLGPLAFII